ATAARMDASAGIMAVLGGRVPAPREDVERDCRFVLCLSLGICSEHPAAQLSEIAKPCSRTMTDRSRAPRPAKWPRFRLSSAAPWGRVSVSFCARVREPAKDVMSKNIYVGNLPFQSTADDLREAFAAYGNVTSAQVVSDRDTGRSRGFGFVEMSDG